MKTKYPTLIIPLDSFDKENPELGLSKEEVSFPEKVFPPHFWAEDEKFICGGYFVSYREKIESGKIAEICSRGNWKQLANLSADFLIFYWDKVKRELCLLTDQTGKFPCFFCTTKERELVLSTDIRFVLESRPCSLNLNLALDYITTGLFLFIYDETLLSEIRQVPPGTLLRINSPPDFTLEPLVEARDFLSIRPHPAVSNYVFANELLEVLEDSVARRLKVIGNLPFGAEISSGLDSPLICYLIKKLSEKKFSCFCGFCERLRVGTDVAVARKFALKHNLQVRFQAEDDFFPFAHQRYAKRVAEFPPSVTIDESLYESFEFAKKSQFAAYFQGLGGDEVYDSHLIDFWFPFRIQEFYFMLSWRFKLGLEKVLTTKGMERLIERSRFENLRIYPNIFSTSAVNDIDIFPIAWEANTWSITPFIDPEVVQFVRTRIPRRGKVASSKIEILKNLKEVFLEDQFKEKVGDDSLFNQFLSERREFAISVFKKSMLAKTGWFRIQDILANLETGRIEPYLEGDSSFYLLYLLRLEYFLQNNNVRISDSW